MTTTTSPGQATPTLRLPRLSRVRLRRFSLFAGNPDAEVMAGDGVLCLVGANGIGKSTLLTAINFCMTGTVPDPGRVFESINEYYRYTRDYSKDFFRGRIDGLDEKDAEITVSFRLGAYAYEITRGLFEPEELRYLSVVNLSGGHESPTITVSDDLPRSERHKAYTNAFVAHSGVASFEEFVFLQHFVFTFDENRKTLFWNPRIMELVLYRAFGAESDMAKRVDSLRREIDAQDSRVRNRQWEATRMRKRINEIRARQSEQVGTKEEFDVLATEHESLTKRYEEEADALHMAEDAVRDAHMQLAKLSVREGSLRDDYARLFDSQFAFRSRPSEHPLVAQSLEDRICGLCGAGGAEVAEAIESRTTGETCPICGSSVATDSPQRDGASDLRRIDSEISAVRHTIRDVHATLEGLQVAETEARKAWVVTKDRLAEFERDSGRTLEALRALLDVGEDQATLTEHRAQLAEVEHDKEVAQEKRAGLKAEQDSLRRSLESHYVQVESTFVPRFSDLARRFLGMALSVQLEARRTGQVRLVVEVKGTTRRRHHQLSESQRFFLDIALRMALTQHMSDAASRGGMFIDTPEGSLDIAYEKRAGDMLASFAESGHQVIMTANVNTSKLLLALAQRCGRSGMSICKMTDWADLSDVQREEEALFGEAYTAIEGALGQ